MTSCPFGTSETNGVCFEQGSTSVPFTLLLSSDNTFSLLFDNPLVPSDCKPPHTDHILMNSLSIAI